MSRIPRRIPHCLHFHSIRNIPLLLFPLLKPFMATTEVAEAVAEEQKTMEKNQTKDVKDLIDSRLLSHDLPQHYIFPSDQRPLAVKSPLQSSSCCDMLLPSIDISPLQRCSQERQQVIRALREACSHWGFFRVTNHGVEEELIEKMMSVANDFFWQTHEEKMKYGSSDVRNPIRYGTSFNALIDRTFIWRDYLRHFVNPQFHAPRNPPEYREVAEQYFGEIRKLALRLLSAISESVGLDPSYIEGEAVGESLFQLGVLNLYPKCPQPDLTFGFTPHSDHGCLTILSENHVAGLQVWHAGHWVEVSHLPESLVVNVGDQMEILSNGLYKSVEHRAVVNSEQTRISIATVNGPSLDKLVVPLCRDGDVPRYKSMRYGDYIHLQQSTQLSRKSKLDLLRI